MENIDKIREVISYLSKARKLTDLLNPEGLPGGAEMAKIASQIVAVAAVIALILSLLQCFFGYKMLRFWVALIGFVIGFTAGSGIPTLAATETPAVDVTKAPAKDPTYSPEKKETITPTITPKSTITPRVTTPPRTTIPPRSPKTGEVDYVLIGTLGAAACAFADRSKLKPVLNKLGLGKLIYLVGALKVCFGTKPACVRISYGGKTRVFKKCLCAIVMNHAYEGGGFKFCPDADFCDGKLDICVGNGISKPAFLKVLPLAYKGMHKEKRGIFLDRAQSFSMTSDIPLWAHTDGEVLGMTRKVYMRLTGEKLNLIV